MKPVIYYTVNTGRMTVRYLNDKGEKVAWPGGPFQDAVEACKEFEIAFPGAQYLGTAALDRKATQMWKDRQKLADWQASSKHPACEVSQEEAELLASVNTGVEA